MKRLMVLVSLCLAALAFGQKADSTNQSSVENLAFSHSGREGAWRSEY